MRWCLRVPVTKRRWLCVVTTKRQKLNSSDYKARMSQSKRTIQMNKQANEGTVSTTWSHFTPRDSFNYFTFEVAGADSRATTSHIYNTVKYAWKLRENTYTQSSPERYPSSSPNVSLNSDWWHSSLPSHADGYLFMITLGHATLELAMSFVLHEASMWRHT